MDCRKIATAMRSFYTEKKINKERSHCLKNLFNVSQRKIIFWGLKGLFFLIKCLNTQTI